MPKRFQAKIKTAIEAENFVQRMLASVNCNKYYKTSLPRFVFYCLSSITSFVSNEIVHNNNN